MGKILGKSALCFTGLAVASWLVYLLNGWLPFAFPPSVFSLFYLSCIQYSLCFLLTIQYSYVLYRMFQNQNRCCLIILLNGIFVVLQFYILLFLSADTAVLAVSLDTSITAGYTVIILSLMFKYLRKARLPKAERISDKVLKILGVLGKSVLCFLAFTAVLYGYFSFSFNVLPQWGFIGFYLSSATYYAVLLLIISYAYVLYRLFRKYAHPWLLLVINAAVLFVMYWLVLLPETRFLRNSTPIMFSYGSAAFCMAVLAFIFRSVEKHYASITLPENQKAPKDIDLPAQTDMQS